MHRNIEIHDYRTQLPSDLLWWLWHLPGGLRWSRSQVQRELYSYDGARHIRRRAFGSVADSSF